MIRDGGDLKVTKIDCKESKYMLPTFFAFYLEDSKYQMAVRIEDIDKAIAEVIGSFDGVEEVTAQQREGIVNYIFKGKTYCRSCRPVMESHCCSSYYLAYAVRSIRWDIRVTRRKALF